VTPSWELWHSDWCAGFALTVQNLHPSGGFKGAGAWADFPGTWRRGRGCQACFNSGYLGREALVELLDIDDTVREIIYEGTTQLHRYLREINFASFRVAAIER